MRIPTPTEYATAMAAQAAYKAFSAPYVQRNGWTVIPADAPRPLFEGEELTTDRINAYSTIVELFELDRDKPERFSAYVQESTREQRDATNLVALQRHHITTWTGEIVGQVTYSGAWHRNNMGARWRSLRVRSAWGAVYHGREYDSRQLVNLRRGKHA